MSDCTERAGLKAAPAALAFAAVFTAALFGAAVLACAAFGATPAAMIGDPAAGASAAGATVSASIPFRFNAARFNVRELSLTQRLFSGSRVVPRADTGVHDAHGVRMRIVRGEMYDFPRGQASYGLDNLNSYRLTGDDFYLDRCLDQARRLVDTHVAGGDGWYYPNRPSRDRHGISGEPIKAPYYSALPQGRILLFFSRLALLTGEARWRAAADHTFAAFLRPGPRRDGPFIVNVDASGYYWLQEWPWWPGLVPDCTLNGHDSSLFGLFEYYMITRDVRARELFRGAVTTVRHYLPQFRRSGWISNYCLAHRGMIANYHRIHVGQLLTLYDMTGATVFARAADDFQNDYPAPAVTGVLVVQPGTYPALRFGTGDRVVARSTMRVRRAMSWSGNLRQRHLGRSAIYLRVAHGRLAGWWLAERSGRVYLRGVAAQLVYRPTRSLVVAAGEACTALDVDAQGTVRGRMRVVSGDGLTVAVGRRAVINGVSRVRVRGGDLDGYWLPLRRGFRLR